MIIHALSLYFVHGPPNNEYSEFNQKCIETISTIIQSRESQSQERSTTTFEALPTHLIGACSSFLDQESYAKLSRLIRAVYLGCSSPNTLRSLFVYYHKKSDHQYLDFSVFQFANELFLKANWNQKKESVVSLEKMNLIASEIAKMPRLQCLDLCQLKIDFIEIIASHQSTNQRIKYLKVDQYGSDATFERFISAISPFTKLEFLNIEVVHSPQWTENWTSHALKPLIGICSNLKGLDLRDESGEMEISILKAVGHNLHYLKLNESLHDDDIEDMKHINYANLRQFVQGDFCRADAIRNVMGTAVNLEKVKVSGKLFEDHCHDQDNAVVLMEEIFEKCERLSYLELYDCRLVTERILNAVGVGLSKMGAGRRGGLKMKFNNWFKD